MSNLHDLYLTIPRMPKTTQRQISRKPGFVRWISAAILVAIGGFFAFSNIFESTDELLQNARRTYQRNQFEEAEQFARTVLKRRPGNAEALWIAGRSCANLKRYDEAVRDLNLIDLGSPNGIESRLLAAAMLHQELYLFDEAEKAYRTVLQRDATHPKANDGLARLLSVCATGSTEKLTI